jgi:tetratricopeptide (TPR) repeat protein
VQLCAISRNTGLRWGDDVKRSAYAFAVVITAFATSLLFSTARADSRADWAKCVSTVKISSDERISSCTAALASGTESWAANRAYYLRGEAHFDKGDFEAAIADFSQFIRSYPSDVQGYRARAAAYYRRHEFDLAIADYGRVIEINPSGPSVYAYYAYRAEVYGDKGDFDQSIADATKAIEINPEFKNAYCIRGHAYAEKGDVEPAIADFNKAIDFDPDYKAAYSGRAAAYRLKGELDLAIADDDEVIRLDPKDAWGYYARALHHWRAGSPSKSLTDLDQAARLNPQNAYVALWREFVARRNEQPSHLADAATQIEMTKWPAPLIKLFLGELKPDQVLAAIDDSDPNRKKVQLCGSHFFAAELALERGSKDEARRLFELAGADCAKTRIESWAADVELKALAANR